MSNQTRSPYFPESQQDISRFKQTATDAASDLSSTAIVHGAKARGDLMELAGHVRKEGLEQIKKRFSDVVSSARHYALERPLVCIGVAFALGFMVGLSRRRGRQ